MCKQINFIFASIAVPYSTTDDHRDKERICSIQPRSRHGCPLRPLGATENKDGSFPKRSKWGGQAW